MPASHSPRASDRYADQARKIINEAQINEDPNVRMIRELRKEIEMLRAQFGDEASRVRVVPRFTLHPSCFHLPPRLLCPCFPFFFQANMAMVQSLREKLQQSQELMRDMNRSWEEKLSIAEKMREENNRRLEALGVLDKVSCVRREGMTFYALLNLAPSP